ncbi:MAG: nucleoside triphosphate pyrophosphohydrolase [Oscillibacter sp.]|nr:nucleoside triphosphate pyrophosphohydrolase [Oscillibacter sp.]
MVDFQCKDFYSYEDFLQIMKLLRSPGGCPWDREQTHESIRRNFLEETDEAVEAIDRKDSAALCEELGDVMMQVVFHAQIEQEAGGFAMADVINGVCQKLVYRHPHVFGEVKVSSSGEVLSNWEVLKRKEKGQETIADAVDAVAKTLPGLWRAEKMVSKASKAGFDWPGIDGELDKLEEETAELRAAVEAGKSADAPHGVQEELGDVLFIAAKIAQSRGIDPEAALHASCDKFASRFRLVETGAAGTPLNTFSASQLQQLWDNAKKEEKT